MMIARYRSSIIASAASVGIALGVGAFIILLSGRDPVFAITVLFVGALGNFGGLAGTLNLAAILLLTGLAALTAFTARIWNVGMEGQLYVGGLASVAFSLAVPNIGGLSVPIGVIAGMVGGAGYAAIPGVIKARFKVNEIVSTLLLNYVALLLVDYIAGGPLHLPGAALPRTSSIPDQFKLPAVPGMVLNSSILIAVFFGILVGFMLRRTKFGFELRMMGGNSRAATYVGVRSTRNTILTMLISGALAGMAGSMLALGTTYAWFAGVSKFYGYLGIGVALLAQLNPILAILSALFFSVLNQGGIAMQSTTGVPFEVSQVIAALIVIVTLIRTVLVK